jgi:putative endopeptidase
MTRFIPTAFVVSLIFMFGCGRVQQARPATPPTPDAHEVDRAGMDPSAAPGDDFFRYCNGAWLRDTQIPPDRSDYGTWAVLSDLAQQRTRAVLEAAAAGTAAAGSDVRKIGDYYASYMDEQAIEAKALSPLRDELNSIASIGDRRALAGWIGSSLRADVDPLNNTQFHTDRVFGIWISQDLNSPARNVPYLLQGGLGVPDRDYYVQESPQMESTRAAYRAHIGAMLKLAGVANADAKATRILDLEHRIANVHATRTESGDLAKGNNPWTRADFNRLAPGLDWAALFHAARLDQASTIIVWHPGAVRGIAALVQGVSLEAWQDYLAFHAIDRHATVLPKPFVDERFAFYDKVLSGTPAQQERWKRAVAATNRALGEAVGKLYVQRFFPAAAKQQLQQMVSNIAAAFDRRLDGLMWMAPTTRASAKAKLAALKIGVGYPDRWRDYSKLDIVRGDAFGNAERSELFEYVYALDKLVRLPDRAEWWITPQTVNALNLPVQNALNFPAAILEPPFYDRAASAAVRYGAIGAIIGHEISHSFDDQGSQVDANGRVRNWWTPGDLAAFKAASAKLVAQYDAYAPFADLHVKGQQTLGENIADVAGISASYDAYRAARSQRTDADAGDDQSFFISYGQTWRSKYREEFARQLVLANGHALDEYRADTVRNLDAWYDAFAVKPGQRLYLSPADRIRVW